MDDTAAVYARQGYGQTMGFGARPALLVVDFTNGFADPNLLGGGNIGAAIDRTVPLLAAARERNLPIVFSIHAYAADGSDFGLFVRKNKTLKKLMVGSHAATITDKLRPRDGELVVTKRHPSLFFGTDVIGWLVERQVDTAIIAGCSTSGCIRSTAVDALCLGLRPIVVRDCVGDRATEPHEANLFDLQQKYADVISLDATLKHLETRARSDSAA